jgi:hypothetical protein
MAYLLFKQFEEENDETYDPSRPIDSVINIMREKTSLKR